MGSSSSKRSPRSTSSSSSWERVRERFAPLGTWCGEHRYVSLGIATAIVALLLLGTAGSFNSTATTITDDEDEMAALDLLDEPMASPDDEVPLFAPPRAYAVRPEQNAGFDDLTPLFGNASPAGSGVVTATFEGASRPVDSAPVWLAGTIETDDVPPSTAFPAATPAALQQATGPLLFPQ